MNFPYGRKEIEYLKNQDKALGDVIDRLGIIEHGVDPNALFVAMKFIIGQQISEEEHAEIWKKMSKTLGAITPATIEFSGMERLLRFGMSEQKAEYIMELAKRMKSGEIDFAEIEKMGDKEAIEKLSSIRGIGQWTAEMILMFGFQRTNIFSYGDMGIIRGLQILYNQNRIDHKFFERCRQKFSPYCSVASLYLWALAAEHENEVDEEEYGPQKAARMNAATKIYAER